MKFGRLTAGVALVVLTVFAACTSTTPVNPVILATASPGPASPTRAPGATDEPLTPTPAEGSFAPPPITSQPVVPLPMSGFVAYEPVAMSGTDYQAFVDTQMSCEALAGWMAAGDWRLDGEALSVEPSTPPASGELTFPRVLWLALSWGSDAAIVSLDPTNRGTDGAPGCEGKISRLSRQPLAATGPYVADTSALVYQYGCTPLDQEVTVVAFEFGDDGSRAILRFVVPLLLGTQPISDATVYLGRNDLSPAKVTAGLADGDISILGVDNVVGGLTKFELDGSAPATATVTSIDPFQATIAFDSLGASGGTPQTLSTAVRCDVSGHALTEAAATPEVTAPPTVAPAGHLEITIGSGADAYSRVVDGPELLCTHNSFDPQNWDLQYTSPDSSGLFFDLFIPTSGEAALILSDGATNVQIDKPRTGGTLTAVVDDRQTEVGFNATGTTPDGRPTTISANCGAITRL